MKRICVIFTLITVILFGTIYGAFADEELLRQGIEEAEALEVGEIGIYNQFNFVDKYLSFYGADSEYRHNNGTATDRNWSTANVRRFLNFLVSNGEYEQIDKEFKILDIAVWPYFNEYSDASVVQFPLYTITYQRVK